MSAALDVLAAVAAFIWNGLAFLTYWLGIGCWTALAFAWWAGRRDAAYWEREARRGPWGLRPRPRRGR